MLLGCISKPQNTLNSFLSIKHFINDATSVQAVKNGAEGMVRLTKIFNKYLQKAVNLIERQSLSNQSFFAQEHNQTLITSEQLVQIFKHNIKSYSHSLSHEHECHAQEQTPTSAEHMKREASNTSIISFHHWWKEAGREKKHVYQGGKV